MSEIWYKTSKWRIDKIEKVSVDRETNSCLFVNGIRVNKFNCTEGHFKTFDEAKAHLLARLRDEHNRAVSRLKQTEENLALAEAIQPD